MQSFLIGLGVGLVAGGAVVYIYHSIIMGKVAAAQALAAGVKKAL